ncbi:hypothetical protein AB0F88_15070 [Streptosporangium sp. NPDC023963]|uniref:hypothetical protein n=1 Tax=Streptosporangium sp. NPDC023963 TaxID=3155608 RepID=UPI00342AA077
MSPRIEDRLRDAFAAGAGLVRAEALRPDEDAVRVETAPRRRGLALTVPLVAALLVVAVSVAVPAWMRGPAAVEPTVEPTAKPTTEVSPGPRFLLVADDDGVTVRDALTGTVIDRVGVPRTPEGSFRDPGGYLLAGTGEGTAFYVARSVTSRRTHVSTTRFHRVRVDEMGKVADLTRDVIPAVTGTAASSLAVSGDGARLAYSLDGRACGEDRTSLLCPGARLAVVDLLAGTTRVWTTDAVERIEHLSWAADRRTLGFVAKSEARVLDTAAAGTTLAAARVVAGGQEVTAATISPDGRTMLVGRTQSRMGRVSHYRIDEYPVTGGGKISGLVAASLGDRTAARWRLIRYDITGRHVLFMGDVFPLSRWDDWKITALVHRGPGDPRSKSSPRQALGAAW